MITETNALLHCLTKLFICAFLFSPQVTALRLNTNLDPYDTYVDKTATPDAHLSTMVQNEDADLQGNWCQGECFTSSEKAYLTEHASELEKGLSVLRGFNCMSPKRVVTGGYFRTGSTLLFNQARLWMVLAFPKGTTVGFDPDMTQFQKSASAVAKQHSMNIDKANAADVLLMSRREVAASVSSRVVVNAYKGNIERVSAASRNELRDHTREQCKVLASMQAHMYSVWKRTGRTVAYDVLLEDWMKDQDREIKAIAKALGVCSQAREDQHLIDMFKFMANELHKGGGDTRITQNHPPKGDVHKQFDSLIDQLIKEIPECNTWAQSHADYMQNHFS